MKKQLLLIFSTAFSTLSFSQPVLQASQFSSSNQASRMNFLQTEGLTAGPGGAQQAWDFSAATPNGSSDTVGLVSVESIGQEANFPTATGAMRTVVDGEVIYQMIRTNEGGMELLGMVSGNSETPFIRRFSNPQKAFALPMAYNQQGADDFEGFMAVSGSAIGIDFKIVTVGGNTYHADGYGSLKVPGGAVFQDVIRIHQVEESVDTVFFESPFPVEPQVTNRKVHSWWWISTLPGENPVKMFISVDSALDEGATDWDVARNAFFEAETVTSNQAIENSTTIQLFPNPAREQFRVQLPQGQSQRIRVMRPDGKLISTFETQTGEAQLPISCAGWQPGLYLIQVESGNKRYTQTLVKE
jgi:hypothetical protein